MTLPAGPSQHDAVNNHVHQGVQHDHDHVDHHDEHGVAHHCVALVLGEHEFLQGELILGGAHLLQRFLGGAHPPQEVLLLRGLLKGGPSSG